MFGFSIFIYFTNIIVTTIKIWVIKKRIINIIYVIRKFDIFIIFILTITKQLLIKDEVAGITNIYIIIFIRTINIIIFLKNQFLLKILFFPFFYYLLNIIKYNKSKSIIKKIKNNKVINNFIIFYFYEYYYKIINHTLVRMAH